MERQEIGQKKAATPVSISLIPVLNNFKVTKLIKNCSFNQKQNYMYSI